MIFLSFFFHQNVKSWPRTENSESLNAIGLFKSRDSNSQSPESVSPTSLVVSTKYSAEEENWVQVQLKKFDDCWKRVHLGEEILQDFIMFNYGDPVSKSFASKTLAVNQERYRLIMKEHSEFLNLDRSQQERLWGRNIFLGTAWSLIKLESCKTGQDQWNFQNDGTPEMSDSSLCQMKLKGKMKKVNLDIVNNLSGIYIQKL